MSFSLFFLTNTGNTIKGEIMNICCFTGYMAENPRVDYVGSILRAEFVLVLNGYRTSKSNGEKSKIQTYITCEAWHTGAEAIEKFAPKGTKMTVNATAKNIDKNDDFIIFRVNEFDICNNSEYE